MSLSATSSPTVATLIALIRASGGEIHIPSAIMQETVTDKWELRVDVNHETKEMTFRAVNTEQAESA